MLPYTEVIAGASTNVTTPTTEQIEQGNNQFTPYNSAINNGYYRQMSQAIFNISAEIENVIEAAGLIPGAALNQLLEAINILSFPVGIVLGWDNSSSIPTNYMALDGSAVLIADIPLLAPVIYCGDANNATADYYYKFTNPANPNGSRSTAGTYILLKDTSGRFARGWKSGQTIDSGRAFNSYQDHAAELHRHSQGEGQILETPNNVYGVTGKTINGVTYGTANATSATQVTGYSSSVQLPSTTSGTVNVASENRPTNYTEIRIIKYQ